MEAQISIIKKLDNEENRSYFSNYNFKYYLL